MSATTKITNIVGINKIKKGGSYISKLYKSNSEVKQIYNGSSLIYRLDQYVMKYDNIGYMSYSDTSYTVSVDSYYLPGCNTSATPISVGVSGNAYTTTLNNNNANTITIYNGNIIQNTSGQIAPYTLYKRPATPVAIPSSTYTYIYGKSAETITFGYSPLSIYTTSWGTFTITNLSNLTPYMTYTGTKNATKGYISYTFTPKFPADTLDWNTKSCKVNASFTTQSDGNTLSASLTHYIVRQPYIPITVKFTATSGYNNGSKCAFIALQRNCYPTNYGNTGSGNYYSAILLGQDGSVSSFCTSMADPTYDYIPNVTTETLLHGLVCQRQEQYASPTQKGWQFGGTKTVTLYIPEAIFYNKSDATIRFLIGCDFANTSVTRTYTVTSNNSNYTISRLTNNYAAKWGFYSNAVTRAQLLANGTFDYSVTW